MQYHYGIFQHFFMKIMKFFSTWKAWILVRSQILMREFDLTLSGNIEMMGARMSWTPHRQPETIQHTKITKLSHSQPEKDLSPHP